MVAGKAGFTEIARGRPMHGTTHSLASWSPVYELRRSAVISGRVFDLGGQPAAHATVIALHAMQGDRGFKNAAPAVQTDQNGRFRLTGLEEGRYLLRASLTAFGAEREASGTTAPILAYIPEQPTLPACLSF